MKIVLQEVERTIAIAFCFRNSEHEIPRALKPWIPHVDHVIAVDGLFKLPYSPKMIENAAKDKAARTIYSTDKSKEVLEYICGDKLFYDTIYATQTEKRQRAFDIAGKLGVDILIIWDSDDYIHPDYQDFDKFYRKLALVTEYNTDEDLFWMNAWIPDKLKWSRQHNNVPENTWRRYTRIHYKPKNQKYVFNHFSFTDRDTRPEDITKYYLINGTDIENPYLKYPHIMIDGVRLTTDRDFRTESQNEYGDSWAFQWMEEEKYRQYLLEMKVNGHADRVKDFKLGTYYYNQHRVLTPYTKEQQELFDSLEL